MNDKIEISNYKYIKTIGEGTFGKVKLAIHILTGEKVAIKILQKKLIKDKNEYNRIEREIKYLKLFNHPNIIQIYEVIESSSSFFIVMEYATGGELFNYIVEKEKLSENESSFCFYQIIQGVKEIHQKKICHRDIKPENLLFTKNKILKIIDFGLSSEYEDYLNTPCGSPCYASPEMIKGKKYNGLSIDLWACGIILFAMLCGYLPFDDKDNNELFRKIVECKIDYPEKDEIELSENSLDLINKILTPNPKKRIGIEDILEHPFMKYGKKVYNNIIKPENFNQEELIIDYMVNELGFNNKNNIIEKYIHSNRHNNITTTFNLLKQKYFDGRFNYQFKEKITKNIEKPEFTKILLYKKNSNNNIKSNDNNSKSNLNNYSKKKIQLIKNKFPFNNKIQNPKNITCNNFNCRKRSRTSSFSQSKKNLLSLKDMLSNKDLAERNNIIIINNTNMIQQPEKLKPIYNNLFFKNENTQNQFFRKIETSVSLEKSLNKNNLTTNNNTDINRLDNAYNNNKNNNTKEQIKVCLKKNEKIDNPLIYFKKIKENNQLLNQKKLIYLPSQNFSSKQNNRKSQKNNFPYNNDYLTYKKNSTGIGSFAHRFNNFIYSFDGNNSNIFNSSLSNQYLNGISYDTNIFNNNKNFEHSAISSSRNKKNNLKNILITDEINNKYKYDSKIINKNSNNNLSNTLEMNRENSEIMSKSYLIKKDKINLNNQVKNVENISKKIFKQNNKRYIEYINNKKKSSYDNKNKEKKRINENFKNKFLYTNHQQTNRESINIKKNKKEYIFPSTSRLHKVNKIINNININNLSNKIIVKNILAKNPNSNNIHKKENVLDNNLKKIIKNNYNINNNFYKKLNSETFREKNIPTLKNLSPKSKKINNENINTVSAFIKKNKIKKNIKDIFSIKNNYKNKSKNKLNTNFNLFQNEKEIIPVNSSSRKYYNKLNFNINYIPITSRDKKLYVSRNQNYEFNNEFSKSNTVLLEKNKNLKNKYISSETKKDLINQKKKNLKEKFLSTNTEMNLYQIYSKIQIFCKQNNLECQNDGHNNFIIKDKNCSNNSFLIEIIDSSQTNQLNVVKFFHGKNISAKMKEIITGILFQISNF